MRAQFNRIVTAVENGVMLVSYITLIVLVGIEAMRRMVTTEQAAWGPEISLYAFVWLTWFAMSSNIHTGRHLAFDEYRDRFSWPVRAVFESLDCLFWLILGAVIISVSVGIVQNNLRFEQVIFGTDIPLWIATMAVPAGWFFSMIRVLQKFWGICNGERKRIVHQIPDHSP
ncbi:MAG: TRAP transporter small permease [Gammaproteobacteria bacterium]